MALSVLCHSKTSFITEKRQPRKRLPFCTFQRSSILTALSLGTMETLPLNWAPNPSPQDQFSPFYTDGTYAVNELYKPCLQQWGGYFTTDIPQRTSATFVFTGAPSNIGPPSHDRVHSLSKSAQQLSNKDSDGGTGSNKRKRAPSS